MLTRERERAVMERIAARLDQLPVPPRQDDLAWRLPFAIVMLVVIAALAVVALAYGNVPSFVAAIAFDALLGWLVVKLVRLRRAPIERAVVVVVDEERFDGGLIDNDPLMPRSSSSYYVRFELLDGSWRKLAASHDDYNRLSAGAIGVAFWRRNELWAFIHESEIA